MSGEPLTDAEVAELDTYGELSGLMAIPVRAMELWEREILYGRVTPPPGWPGLIESMTPLGVNADTPFETQEDGGLVIGQIDAALKEMWDTARLRPTTMFDNQRAYEAMRAGPGGFGFR